MNINNLPDRLFDLLINHSFDELPDKDRYEIQEHLTPQEYNEMHQFMMQFSEADQSLNNSIKFDVSVNEPSLWSRIMNYPVPLYKVAAIFLALIGSSILFFNKDDLLIQSSRSNTMVNNISIEEGFYPEDLLFEL